MKKFLYIFFILLLLPVCAAAAEPELHISGSETIYAQDYFTVELTLPAENVTGVEFTLTYDAEHLNFMGLDSADVKGWECQAKPNRFVFTAEPERSAILTLLQFRLKDVAVGTAFWVALEDVILTVDGTAHDLGTVRWEQVAARPVSTDNYLSSLKISDGVLSPSFAPTKQQYTATVSYHIASIDVTAEARDPYAQVDVSSPALTPDGVTNVTVTVTAEDGTRRVYTIAVTREEDPNRPLSSDCTLSDIVVLGFMLSPEFQPKVTEYVLWLPYEVTSVDIGGIAKDPRATVKVEGNKGLKAGKDNPITITCTAEDGSQKVYTVIAKRAEEYVPETTVPPTQMPTEDVPASNNSTEAVKQPDENTSQSSSDVDIPSWTYIVLAIAAVTGAAAVGILVSERKQ